PFRAALWHCARAGPAPREPAAGEDLDAGRARGGHLPGRRRSAAAQPRAARDRERAARRDRPGAVGRGGLRAERRVVAGSLGTVAAAEAVGFDAVIDVRSPAEFADDHLPGAVNWPVLDDEQRRTVGTLYVQESPLAARKLGAAMVARNIAAHLERWVQDKPRE